MSLVYPCVYHENGKCKRFSDDEEISFCVFGPCKYETPSNADRIRAMSDEELADARVVEICGISSCTIWVALDVPDRKFLSKGTAMKVELEYLQQPSEEE